MKDWDRDYMRFAKCEENLLKQGFRIWKNHGLRYMFLFRKRESAKGKLMHTIYSLMLLRLQHRYGIEINTQNVAGGVLLIHPYNITINGKAIIGEDFTVFKGATVGSIRSGKRAGSPTIGNRVTICPNAMVCGGISIGDDVMISANAFVDFDVPANSIVIGNPAFIKHKENASKDYL